MLRTRGKPVTKGGKHELKRARKSDCASRLSLRLAVSEMWPRNTSEVIQEGFVQGCARSGVCSCVGCCCSAGKGSCLATFGRIHWVQTWRYKVDEVKALRCLVVNPLHLKHFSHHLGLNFWRLGVSWPQGCKRLLCILKDDSIYYLKDSDQM